MSPTDLEAFRNERGSIDFSRPVEIAPDIFWVGNVLENDPFQCHPYFIRNGKNSVLIDPGSMLQLEKIIEKITMACDLSDVRYIILHHQDPDLCAAVPHLEKLIKRPDLEIITHSRMSVLIKHYGIDAPYYNIDQHNFVIDAGGRTLRFYTTPYCHSPGAFVTYDETSKVLFSSDIFGGLEDSWHFYADENYFKSIEGFHMAYMPSRDILNYALRKIEALDLELIAPQHGSVIRKPYIAPLIEQMKQMECGLYIDRKYGKDLLRTIEKLNNLQTEFEVSLDEIKNLKRRQDGDYFLTSLLMRPLLKNFNKSDDVTTDFVIIQKKSFLFKDRHYQLGGDLCVSGNMLFNGQRFTLFFNGDAMGKSVQGAGGALVMGTVLNSIIARSAGNDRSLDVDPEQWLRETYDEIQTLFLSFDGAMMVSGILGLLNEETGELLFVNAEHPFLILYRNGQAQFIDEELTLRKFGSPSELDFFIHSFQLQPGDVLISGSDGKDDLNLRPGETVPQMNQDYRLILKIIEKSKGNLRRMVKSIFAVGEITDDLSLLRVGFKEPAHKREPQELTDDLIYELQISNHIRNRSFSKALDLMEGPSEKQSPEILFYRGFCFIQEKRYLKALKYLTRAIQLKPDYFRALKYAGIAHYRLGNLRKCESYWNQARAIRPDDSLIESKYPEVIKRLERQKVLLGRKQMNE